MEKREDAVALRSRRRKISLGDDVAERGPLLPALDRSGTL
jgi:hypothetical protein